jgi:SAM-dependent methyltransferase
MRNEAIESQARESARRQQRAWQQRSLDTTGADVVRMYQSPCRFQLEFSSYLNDLGRARCRPGPLRVCEVGCEFGVTSLLLSPLVFRKHCLDLNERALTALRQAAHQLGQDVVVHRQDMFQMAIRDGSFDVVFSNGVLEHYSAAERIRALRECARIARPGGIVIVGVPNHLSLPYRTAYLFRRLTGRWPFPPEERIEDFAVELAHENTLSMGRTMLFDKETIYALLPLSRYSSLPFRLADRYFHFEPYLRVIELDRLPT